MSSEGPPNKKLKFSLKSLQTAPTTITVLVGSRKTKFSVPRYQIREASQFFKNACRGDWNSGEEEIVLLPDENPEIFGIFVVWMITKNIKKAEHLIDPDSYIGDFDYDSDLEDLSEQLAKCIFLGFILQAPNFQNDVMDLLISTNIAYAKDSPNDQLGCNEGFMMLVYENTASNSPLRRYIQDGILAGVEIAELPRIIPKDGSAWGHEFLIELMQRAVETARDHRHNLLEQPNLTNRCKYHIHPGKPEDYSCVQDVEVSSSSE